VEVADTAVEAEATAAVAEATAVKPRAGTSRVDTPNRAGMLRRARVATAEAMSSKGATEPRVATAASKVATAASRAAMVASRAATAVKAATESSGGCPFSGNPATS
jgi:hypothetical protein